MWSGAGTPTQPPPRNAACSVPPDTALTGFIACNKRVVWSLSSSQRVSLGLPTLAGGLPHTWDHSAGGSRGPFGFLIRKLNPGEGARMRWWPGAWVPPPQLPGPPPATHQGRGSCWGLHAGSRPHRHHHWVGERLEESGESESYRCWGGDRPCINHRMHPIGVSDGLWSEAALYGPHRKPLRAIGIIGLLKEL